MSNGVLSELEVYTVAELLKRGISREFIGEARRSGIAPPAMVGKKHVYFGKELIAFMAQTRAQQLDGIKP